MKNVFRTGTILFLLAIFAVACEPETDNVPKPTDARDAYTGTWSVAETSQIFGETGYSVNIKIAAEENVLLIENFYNLGFNNSARARLSGTSLTLDNQTLSGHQLNGSGSISSSKSINLSFTINDGSGADAVTAALSR